MLVAPTLSAEAAINLPGMMELWMDYIEADSKIPKVPIKLSAADAREARIAAGKPAVGTCSRCGETKAGSEFYWSKLKFAYDSYCRRCKKTINAERKARRLQ